MHTDDDLVPILEDEHASRAEDTTPAWRILIVDDDEEVHASTRYALNGVQVAGRRLAMAHAQSAAEARALLQTERDFAVILLDVVMETDSAGLDMVDFIRNDMGMNEVRIILRTGQPGYAPELDVFNGYDINDYRTKAELTRIRLITAITSALRSYQQIRTIAEHRHGLELIIAASSDLMAHKANSDFAAAVLNQLAAVLQRPVNGLVCTREDAADRDDDPATLRVIGTCGRYSSAAALALPDICDAAAMALIRACLSTCGHHFDDARAALHLRSTSQQGLVLIDTTGPLSEAERRLLEVFATNIAASLGNVRLFEQLNHIAYHDSLTTLPNRTSFICSLDDVVTHRADVTVALVDLRHFGDLNNGLGQETGNALLIAVAHRMRRQLGAECVVARMSADVFGLVGPPGLIRPEKILALFAAPFEVAGNWIPVGVTIGLYHSTGDEPNGLTLLRRVNIALNHARHGSSERLAHFAREMEDSARACDWRTICASPSGRANCRCGFNPR
jgi:diguanylate cyclase (GGDEF)-like protein